jgi:hypothetical protein
LAPEKVLVVLELELPPQLARESPRKVQSRVLIIILYIAFFIGNIN